MTDPESRSGTKAIPWVKIQTILLAGVFVLLVLLLVVIGIAGRRMEKSLNLVQENLEALEMDHINEVIASLTEAADHLAKVDIARLNDTALSLKAAAESLSDVDVKTMNEAIASLKDAANTLKNLDIQSLNGVIQSIDRAVQGLETAVNTLKGIFGH